MFIDGDVGEWLTVNTRFLFDHNAATGAPIVRLDGAFATFWSLFGVDALNLQAGNVPWPFGSYGPRTYSDLNPVIGAPLMYSYHTTIKPGDGSVGNYGDTGGDPPHNLPEQLGFLEDRDPKTGAVLANAIPAVDYQHRGLIPIYESWWSNGAVALGAVSIFDYAIGVTTGALSNPKAEGNGRPSYVGRIGIEPMLGISAGISGSWGPYLIPEAAGKTGTGKTAGDPEVYGYNQLAVGADLSLLTGPLSVFAEGIRSQWQVPNVTPELGLWSWFVEARYDILAQLYVALRYDHMIFDRVAFLGSPTPWDYDLLRFEPAIGIRLARSAQLKIVGQLTFRDGPSSDTEDYLLAAQLSLGF